MTNIEYDYMSNVPSRLKGIEDQLKRIADTLESYLNIILQGENKLRLISFLL